MVKVARDSHKTLDGKPERPRRKCKYNIKPDFVTGFVGVD